ncbi:MAG: citryl-CoA lyase [Acidobacteriota bacterium]|nr:citryl-CoA lyase [Acidobacteriota bacterium]
MTPWRTSVVRSDETSMHVRGYDIRDLMLHAGFVETVFLLHQGRLPSAGERRLLDAILVGVSDHGAGAPSCAVGRMVASSNRQSVAAAVGAGVLAIGDEHGGAGALCMEMIAEGLQLAARESIPPDEAAARTVEQRRARGQRLPGFGHRVHTTDPRVKLLFAMEKESGIETKGAEFVEALERHAAARIKPLPINIDGALAAILHDLGFPASAARFIFIIGRVAGITAEVAEEIAREKPMRVRIPIEYDGDPPKEFPESCPVR